MKAGILSPQPASPTRRPLSPPKQRKLSIVPLWRNAPLTPLAASDYAAQANPSKRSLRLPKIERPQSPPGYWRKIAEASERIAAKRASNDAQPSARAANSQRASKDQQDQQQTKPKPRQRRQSAEQHTASTDAQSSRKPAAGTCPIMLAGMDAGSPQPRSCSATAGNCNDLRQPDMMSCASLNALHCGLTVT